MTRVVVRLMSDLGMRGWVIILRIKSALNEVIEMYRGQLSGHSRSGNPRPETIWQLGIMGYLTPGWSFLEVGGIIGP